MPGLQAVLENALNASEAAQLQQYFEEEARGRRVASRAAVLPSLRTSVSLRQEEEQGSADESSFEDRVVYDLTLSQPLYHWGARDSEKEIGSLRYDIETLNASQTASQIVQNTRRGYMGLVIAKQELEASSRSLELKREAVARQRKEVDAGSASEASLESLEIELERQELTYLSALNDWETSLIDFALYVGMDRVAVEAQLAAAIPKVAVMPPEKVRSLLRYVQPALETDEALRKQALEVEIAKNQLEIEKVATRPKFDAEIGMSSNALDDDGTRREQEFVYFGLRVGWDIFDGFRTKGRQMEAAARLARTRKLQASLRGATERIISRQLLTLELAARTLAIDERLMEKREKGLASARDGVVDQRVSQAQLDDLEEDFALASIQLQRSRMAYFEAVARFVSLAGLEEFELGGGN